MGVHELLALARDPEEGPFILPFLAGSADEGARRRYRDWLVERGDPRGEVVTLLESLEAPTPRVDLVPLRARFTALAAAVSPAWLALFRAVTAPLHCGLARAEAPAVRFAFECPRAWASLDPTDDPTVRRCDGCGERVYFSATRDEAERRAREGACVAVPASLLGALGARFSAGMTGRPHAPELWGERIFGDP